VQASTQGMDFEIYWPQKHIRNILKQTFEIRKTG
jgi:hypothetical protein